MTSGPLVWGYETAPGSAIGGRTMVYPQARVLGGGSSINAQVFTRGCPEDYDAWARGRGLRRLVVSRTCCRTSSGRRATTRWPAISMASTGRSASARERRIR